MGMFDRVRCRYPLPHHQDAEFQTEDLARIARDEPWLGGFLDEYEISEDGRLTRHVHEREWREDPKSLFGAMAGPLPLHVEYITDEAGAKRAVVLQIEEFEELLEDLHDLAVVADRREEETVSHDQVIAELEGDGSS